MNRKLKMAFRVISMALVLFITVQIIPVHSYAAENVNGVTVPEQQEIIVPADYERVLDEGYKTYTMDAGRGGTFTLDTQTLSWVISRRDIGFSGNRMSASLSWIYSKGDWILNYSQSLVYTEAKIFKPAYYTMYGLGSSIKFDTDSGTENGVAIWKSKDTPDATLYLKENTYTVKTKTIQYDFNSTGRVVNIINLENGDKIQVLYRADGNYEKIIDAVGREYRFAYDTVNGILSVSSITAYNASGQSIQIEGTNSTIRYGYQKINDKNCLKEVTYPDGKQVHYQYNENGNLIEIDGVSRNVSISYDGYAFAAISDGNRSMSYSRITDPDVNIMVFTDQDGNADRVPVKMLPGHIYPLAVYDKDWHTVYSQTIADLMLNGCLYDYANMGVSEEDYDPSWRDVWKVYNHEEKPVPYVENGGVDLRDGSGICQTLNIQKETDPYMLFGIVYSDAKLGAELFCGGQYVTLNNESGIKYILTTKSNGSNDIIIKGPAIIKKVFLHTNIVTSSETQDLEIDSCICPKCETLDCPCRCESEAECECSQCVSRVTETKDKYGNLLMASRSADGKTLKSTNTYTSNGDFLTSSTDENGVKVNYNYNQGNGLLESASNENGTSVNYSYDAIGALKSVQTQVDGQTMSNQYTYLKDRLSSISHNGFSYYFDYDNSGNLLSTKVNNTILANYTYQNDDLKEITFANGQKVSYQYKNHCITGIDIDNDGEMEYTYTYNIYNELDTAYDHGDYTKTVIRNGVAVTTSTDGEQIKYAAFEDKDTKKLTETVNDEQLIYQTNQTQASSGAVTSSIQINNDRLGISVTDTEDSLKRLSSHKVMLNGSNTSLTTSCVYKNNGSLTGTQAEQINTAITSPDGGVRTEGFGYTYDTLGNVLSESRSGSVNSITAYSYDEVNQLRSEDNIFFNGSYTYDLAGNLSEKKIIDKTTGERKTIKYGYDSQWKDLLVSYDGAPISYDALGNVTADSKYIYTWIAGRRLRTIENQPGQPEFTTHYGYDSSGLRTQKYIFTETEAFHYYYVWSNNQLVGIVMFSLEGKNTLRFLYGNGNCIGFLLNETTPYFYVKNLMGDICEIVDKNGATVATYQYDAWGNVLKSEGDATILQLNPFTYRGYIYDSETKLYYLQTRYYNPEWNRFINADTNLDTQTSIVGTNVFAYCDNNPVMNTDNTGMSTAFDEVIPAILNALFGFALFENILESIGVNVAKFWTIADRLFGMFPQLLDFVVNKIVDLCVNGINFIGKWFENMINHFIPINDIRNGSLKFFEWGSTLYHLTGLDAIFGLQNIALDIIGSIGETALLIKLLSILVNPFVSTVLSIEMLAQVGSIGINIASLITGIFCVVKYGGYSYRIFNIGFGFLFSATIISGR